MSTTALTRSNRLAVLPLEIASQLTETTTRAVDAFSAASDENVNVVAALDVAVSIADLRTLFDTPAVKERVLALADTSIGFRTDSDPKVFNKRKNAYNEPYPYPVLRDCAIEACLRGLQLVGNQFNVISGRQYTTKEGMEYLIRKLKNVSEFRPIIGVPRNLNGGAIVECKATWKQGGTPMNLEASIPVKIDDYSTADQTIGKATRKFLRRCYEMMSGRSAPDADVETETPVEGVATPPTEVRVGRSDYAPTPAPQAPATDADEIPMNHPPKAPAAPAPEPPAPPKPEPKPAPAPVDNAETVQPPPRRSKPTPAPVAAPVEKVEQPAAVLPPRMLLASLVDAAGYNWAEFSRCAPVLSWLDGQDGRPDIANITGYGDIPDEIAGKLIGPNGKATGIIAQLGRQRIEEQSQNPVRHQQPR